MAEGIVHYGWPQMGALDAACEAQLLGQLGTADIICVAFMPSSEPLVLAIVQTFMNTLLFGRGLLKKKRHATARYLF